MDIRPTTTRRRRHLGPAKLGQLSLGHTKKDPLPPAAAPGRRRKKKTKKQPQGKKSSRPVVVCESTQDCAVDESEDCSSQGTCQLDGQCKSTEDCFDPDNTFSTMDCVGPITCNRNDGACHKTCSPPTVEESLGRSMMPPP